VDIPQQQEISRSSEGPPDHKRQIPIKEMIITDSLRLKLEPEHQAQGNCDQCGALSFLGRCYERECESWEGEAGGNDRDYQQQLMSVLGKGK
jgi:hypothetical protein